MKSSELTRGVGIVGAILLKFGGGTSVAANAGAPTNGTSGTFAGTSLAYPSALLIDTTNKALYQNTNTKLSPTWSKIASAGVLAPELAQDNVTAGTTQTQAGATALTGQVVRVGTVATAGDGVRLPTSVAGLIVTLVNDGANPMKVYGAGTDTINSIATATGLYQGTGTTAMYSCTVAGNWKVSISALQGTIPVALAGDVAILPDAPQSYRITKGSAAADTIAAPASQSDGQLITIVSETAFAHVITATGLFLTGGAAVNTATFLANAGASLTLMVRGGKLIVVQAEAVTFA